MIFMSCLYTFMFSKYLGQVLFSQCKNHKHNTKGHWKGSYFPSHHRVYGYHGTVTVADACACLQNRFAGHVGFNNRPSSSVHFLDQQSTICGLPVPKRLQIDFHSRIIRSIWWVGPLYHSLVTDSSKRWYAIEIGNSVCSRNYCGIIPLNFARISAKLKRLPGEILAITHRSLDDRKPVVLFTFPKGKILNFLIAIYASHSSDCNLPNLLITNHSSVIDLWNRVPPTCTG